VAQPTDKYVVARAADLPVGSRLIVNVGSRSIGIFNVDGRLYAMLNRCPHKGAALCRGDVIDLVVSDRPGEFRLVRDTKLLACPWHGWEYDMETGASSYDPLKGRARPLEVEVESGSMVAHAVAEGTATKPARLEGIEVDPQTRRIKGPYTAEVFPVVVEDDYVVVSMKGLQTSNDEQS
jgi:nitrite reductase/ring-hydroxylating ferredoxin subunit